MGPNAISWSSKKQSTIAKLSTEAGYQTIAPTTIELLWLRELLKELCIPLIKTPTLYSDNIGANYLCANVVFHTQMKHLAIDYHFVRELVANKELHVSHSQVISLRIYLLSLSHVQDWLWLSLLDFVGVCWHTHPLRRSSQITNFSCIQLLHLI